MSIDKKIDYVEQDGFKNYIKNSDSVTVPRKFKARKDATPTKLAYITSDEAKMLKKMKRIHHTKDHLAFLVTMTTMHQKEIMDNLPLENR